MSKFILFILFGACALMSCGSVHRQTPKEPLYLSREAFIREMVLASKTETTEHFSDHPGSYHVEKLDLINGVFSLSDSTTKRVIAVLIIGPVGPLWQYNVITVIDSAGKDGTISINHLVFPHARITFKSTRELVLNDYRQIMDRIQSSPLLRNATDKDETSAEEWNLSLVFAKFDSAKTVRVVSNPVTKQDKESLKQLYDIVEELVDRDNAVVTYD